MVYNPLIFITLIARVKNDVILQWLPAAMCFKTTNSTNRNLYLFKKNKKQADFFFFCKCFICVIFQNSIVSLMKEIVYVNPFSFVSHCRALWCSCYSPHLLVSQTARYDMFKRCTGKIFYLVSRVFSS